MGGMFAIITANKEPMSTPGFHRGCDAEEINDIGEGDFRPRQPNILEEPLSLSCITALGLSRQFLTVEPEDISSVCRQEAVVVGCCLSSSQRYRGAERVLGTRYKSRQIHVGGCGGTRDIGRRSLVVW